jgi:hypothetical protein
LLSLVKLTLSWLRHYTISGPIALQSTWELAAKFTMTPHITKKKKKKTIARSKRDKIIEDRQTIAATTQSETNTSATPNINRIRIKAWRKAITATAVVSPPNHLLASSSQSTLASSSTSTVSTHHYLSRRQSLTRIRRLACLTSTTHQDWRVFEDRRCLGYLSPTGECQAAMLLRLFPHNVERRLLSRASEVRLLTDRRYSQAASVCRSVEGGGSTLPGYG